MPNQSFVPMHKIPLVLCTNASLSWTPAFNLNIKTNRMTPFLCSLEDERVHDFKKKPLALECDFDKFTVHLCKCRPKTLSQTMHLCTMLNYEVFHHHLWFTDNNILPVCCAVLLCCCVSSLGDLLTEGVGDHSLLNSNIIPCALTKNICTAFMMRCLHR